MALLICVSQHIADGFLFDLQTRGAVRDTVKLSQAAFWYKIYIAAAAAAAEQAYELQQLDIVMGYLNISMLDAAMAVWDVNNVADKDAFDMQQMRNGTCLCGTALTDLLKGTIGFSTAAAYTDPAGNCSGVCKFLQDIFGCLYSHMLCKPCHKLLKSMSPVQNVQLDTATILYL
eukprot:GHRR01023261.1.p1 GENE.GHRR01023261.1~~GHRR01023261.1.p1  ORF type:complete len:174 (-),score=39.01 GHRR01023261.1:557-1078(-)